jgi:hypothetical protein
MVHVTVGRPNHDLAFESAPLSLVLTADGNQHEAIS